MNQVPTPSLAIEQSLCPSSLSIVSLLAVQILWKKNFPGQDKGCWWVLGHWRGSNQFGNRSEFQIHHKKLGAERGLPKRGTTDIRPCSCSGTWPPVQPALGLLCCRCQAQGTRARFSHPGRLGLIKNWVHDQACFMEHLEDVTNRNRCPHKNYSSIISRCMICLIAIICLMA